MPEKLPHPLALLALGTSVDLRYRAKLILEGPELSDGRRCEFPANFLVLGNELHEIALPLKAGERALLYPRVSFLARGARLDELKQIVTRKHGAAGPLEV